MPTLPVFWRATGFDPEQQDKPQGDKARSGVLTDEHEAVTDENPVVLVEDISKRVYHPADLPPDTVLQIEGSPRTIPPLADRAREAGFQVEHA